MMTMIMMMMKMGKKMVINMKSQRDHMVEMHTITNFRIIIPISNNNSNIHNTNNNR
jgi:hypothetical protein